MYKNRDNRYARTWIGIQILLLILTAVSVGCISSIPITKGNVMNSVLAQNLGERGSFSPHGITDVFTLEGKVYIYTILTWSDIDKLGGPHKMRHEWYTNGKMEAKSGGRYFFGKPPYAISGSIPTSALGVGKHSVRQYVDDVLIVEKHFRIMQKVK